MEDPRNEFEKRQLRLLRVQTAVLMCILVLLVAGGIFLTVQLADLGDCLALVERQLQGVDMDEVNRAVGALTGAAQELGNVDMDALNQAVAALAGAAENLQDLDFEALNTLVKTLETVASRLERVTSFFG